MSKDLDLRNYINLNCTPGAIKAVEVYFDILKDLLEKDRISLSMFFVLLSAYIDEWKEKIINNEADKVKEIWKKKY